MGDSKKQGETGEEKEKTVREGEPRGRVRKMLSRLLEGFDWQRRAVPAKYQTDHEVVPVLMSEEDAAEVRAWLTCPEPDKV